VTRARLTDDDTRKAPMLEPPGVAASGDVNETSSMLTVPDATPRTESA
jgi:hypothetical protein